jgi:hypothetical protein
MKGPFGEQSIIRESIWTVGLVTDEDGSLKIKRVEEFTDSKAYLSMADATALARAG